MWTTYAIIFVVLIVLELIYIKIADKFNIIDKPNQRSSHTRIVLRGGGNHIYHRSMGMEYLVWFSVPLAAGRCDIGGWSVVY